MAVTANQIIKRQDGCKGSAPVEEAVHLYQGTLAFFNAAGYLVGIVASGVNPFAGVMIEEADNSAGADGAINGEFWTDGDFPMVGSGFTQATVGLDIYASDNYTVGTSGSSTSYVGKCVGYVSSTVIIVQIKKNGPAASASVAATGSVTSSSATAGIGYAAGAGGTVSQATDRTTGVTLNKVSGAITTQATSLAAQTSVAFTVTNSTVAIGDTIVLSIRSGPTGTKTIAAVTTVAAGSFQITLFNTDASVADTGAAIINFAVIKAVSA